MDNSVDHFELLKQQLATLEAIPSDRGEISYFAQEALRFYSIAGTLRENDMLKNASAAERQISHILGRSLLEGFFWLIYIFDDPAKRATRFEEKINAFKREYGKFWNEPIIPRKKSLEAADPDWAALPRPKDVNSMLAQAANDHGDKLSYLYFTYRVASFDTHGNSMDALFQAVFGKPCNFAVLDFAFGFDLIANHYLVIMGQLHDAGEI
ncbi:hypothetical protein [Marilutibacter alkalisoli]|uniref:Uncharacterized protein n=1 Tax=Marilutibacter alkalisoli TaxID=2591633 RepID=A0A514BQM3_9GAMM|nr:hypothetical protein [Lysobacter alkalisoli]QDH69698.1 hypothetical protein FKV23_06005 [Lysobacter alkalisoli]